ncbi:hypothetical protein GM415_05010 [Pseudodesulfovibrio cashew]|uniref:Lipoprotein n=1 Tax=Pseudodesulfovibrio cashew TaxID=2678688 RepID=A0A6I6JPF2_9BACT|nr:hypothetical protein [Pseudodesulfovibrio cashew]QGY39504.1 hypothetical protein GM415_05010 [Pseudodesulfovibrio cashew]
MLPHKLGWKKLVVCMMLVLLPVLQGCPALLIIALVSSDDYVSGTVEIPRSADEVFAAVKARAQQGIDQETQQEFIISKMDEGDRFVQVKDSNDTWWMEVAIVPLSARSSRLQMIGHSTGDEKAQVDRGLRAIARVCDDLGVKYRVVETSVGDDN